MSSRSMSPPPPPSGEADLESTAELPVLDPAAAPEADEKHTSTDTWAVLPQLHLRSEGERHLEATLEAMSAELRSAQQLLRSKGERLVELERERDEAQAAHAAAAQRAQETATAAQQQQSLEVEHAEQAAQLSAEQHAAGLAAELAHLRSGASADGEELAQLRAAAEQRAAQLDAELRRLQLAATEHAAQFAELAQARASAEQHGAQLQTQLATTRTELAAAAVRTQELTQRLREQEAASAALLARQQQSEQARVARERAEAAHLTDVMTDLEAERARARAYFESLQSMTSRHGLFEGLVTELEQQAQLREAARTQLAQELALRQGRLREQDTELKERGARLARLEQQVIAFGSALADRDARLLAGQRDAQTLREEFSRAQAQLTADGERLRALSAVAAQHSSGESQRKSELSRLLGERVELATALESARGGTLTAQAQAAEQTQAATAAQSRAAELERLLSAERKRATDFEIELGELRHEMEAWGDALKSVHQERGTYQSVVAAADARAREAERREVEQRDALAAAQAQARSGFERVGELEAALAAVQETLQRFESQSRPGAQRAAELDAGWHEQRHGATDTGASPELREAVRRSDEFEPAATALPEGATRVLIYSEDGREIVHVLGRKTSVGRTPDNDLQIDAKFISRHHAVILAGPAQTIIEDLNSTNGVMVNGRRVTRQVLEDGDLISIGRQQYRFVIRRKDDQR
jgi:chromosome segregation ATPase